MVTHPRVFDPPSSLDDAFDAQIAAVCREHGVGRLLTQDRDFSRFPWIEIIDLDEDPEDFV